MPCWITWVNKMAVGLEQVFNVTPALVKDCYYIVDQTRPGEAAVLYNTLREDVERRGHVMFVFNGAAFPLGFIKGQILRIPDFKSVGVVGIQSKIDYLFVDKKYQRAGIGALLLRAYESYCRDNGVGNIILYSAPTVQATGFYAKNGYVRMNGNLLMAKVLGMPSH